MSNKPNSCPTCGMQAWRTGQPKVYGIPMYYQCCNIDCGAVWEFWENIDEYYKDKYGGRVCGV